MIIDRLRHVVAVIFLVTAPPSVCVWLLIHPFIQVWKRLGAVRSYLILSLPILAAMTLIWLGRDSLLSTEYGTQYPLLFPSLLCFATAGWIAVKCERQLTFHILVGIPELSQDDREGKLLVDGIYARIRHPRYLEVALWIAGYAFFADYLALYIVAACTLPILHLVVLLEERELNERFGAEYAEYCQRVPRYVPNAGR